MAQLADVITTPEQRSAYIADGCWRDETLADRLRAHATDRAGHTAVVDGATGASLSYGELFRAASGVVAYLREQGVAGGDVVALQMPNCVEAAIGYSAAFLLGTVVIPLLPQYRAKELRHVLSISGAKAIVTPVSHRNFDFVPMVTELRRDLPALDVHIVSGSADGLVSVSDLVKSGSAGDIPRRPAREVSELIFTSGTESVPKAVMHTEETTNFGVRVAREFLGLTDQDVVWMPSPIGHSTGLNYGLRLALFHGLPIVLQDRWDAADARQMIERYNCSYTLAATTFLNDLAAECALTGTSLPAMRYFSCGGAPVPPRLVDRAGEFGIRVLRLYGSTELLVASWTPPDASDDDRRNFDGRTLPGTDLKVVGADGTPLPPSIGGELQGRSPSACVGFFDDPERTKSTFLPEGWIRTGDIASLDDKGFVRMVGRSKEIVIRGGVNIAPREIEELLAGMPDVVSAAVVGLPDERLGERACAFLVMAGDARPTLDDVRAHLETRGIARYKFPEQVEFIDALPMTASGKVQKHLLKARLGGMP